ncbi:MAG: YaiI/YqxD family protein [Actinobacteria bacterium]|nr:YaiI/YqxD family protein [Actinomycetota bacterium]
MHIWVDADALPGVLKKILFRLSERMQLPLTFVANKPLSLQKSPFIDLILVKPGLDVADEEIIARVEDGDLVITADIPLAAAVIEKGAVALSSRGELFTRNNIGERLSMRNFMQGLREAGVDAGGPAPFSQRDRENFANQLDRFITERLRG